MDKMAHEFEIGFFARLNGFEWDENKRHLNIAKHGIDFVDAIEAFGDPRQYTYRSPIDQQEERYVTVGLARGIVVAVVFVWRGNQIRIISARNTRRRERETYG
jgi:uncharacterized protein